mmetsp:Transcript_82485/g.218893  ORF Transcript_82485/g.218893 Transcript_82485/m.218893 type:complete len:243 (-) Transcript_82485:1073-1801(-)
MLDGAPEGEERPSGDELHRPGAASRGGQAPRAGGREEGGGGQRGEVARHGERGPDPRGLLGHLRHQVRPPPGQKGERQGPRARRRQELSLLPRREVHRGQVQAGVLHGPGSPQQICDGRQQKVYARRVCQLRLRAPEAKAALLSEEIRSRPGAQDRLGRGGSAGRRSGAEAREPRPRRRRRRLPSGGAGRHTEAFVAATAPRGARRLAGQPHRERLARGPYQRDPHGAAATLLVQRVPALRR